MQANPTFFIGAIGSLMLLVAALHSPRSEMAIPYRFYGIALVGATLVLLRFHGFNEEVVRGGGTLWLVRFGLIEDRSRAFGAGVGYLLLWAVLRYIDLFGAFGGMLGASLLFFACGGALTGVALYWRNRKAVSLG